MRNQIKFSGLGIFLRKASLSVAVLFVSCGSVGVLAQSAASLDVERLSDKALFVQGPDSNVLVVDSSEGLIMVDGGHADWQAELQSVLAEQFPGKPVRALFNTHWHPEQTGSNLALGEQGVEIIAH